MPIERSYEQYLGDGTGAVRGDLAYALYNALGIEEPSSMGRFGDSGPYLDAVTSTLADLGITNGVGEGTFGTTAGASRGEAFTMIARALGLADANSSIEEASAALQQAGIVKGYADGSLGLGDPITKDQMGMLMKRVQPVLDSRTGEGETTLRDQIIDRTNTARDQSRARQDPAFAAYLANMGVARGEIDDEIALRQSLFNDDLTRRSESYQRLTDEAMKGIGSDFENRGFFRSGTRMMKQANKRQEIGYRQEAENYAAQRAFEERQRALNRERNKIDRDLAQERVNAQTRIEEQQIQEQY